MKVMEKGVEILKRAKEKGYKIYSLSNFHTDAFEIIRKQHDFFNLFDGFCVSSHCGEIKPEDPIYGHALKISGCTASEALFIDDMKDNVDSGNRLGILSLQCVDHQEVINQLEKLKIF